MVSVGTQTDFSCDCFVFSWDGHGKTEPKPKKWKGNMLHRFNVLPKSEEPPTKRSKLRNELNEKSR